MAQEVNIFVNLFDRVSRTAKRVSDTLDKLEGSARRADDRVNDLNDTLNKDSKRAFDDHQKRLEDAERAIKDFSDANDDLRRVLTRGNRELGDVTSALDRYNVSAGRASSSTIALGRGIQGLNSDFDGLGRGIRGASGDFDGFTNRIRRFLSGRGEVRKAFREVMDFSFFRSGVVSGLQFFDTATKILGIIPLLTVSIGGLTQIFGSLGTGILQVVGSLGRLTGALAVLPGLYAAIGSGILGFSTINSLFVQSSVKGTEELESLDKQIASVNQSLNQARADAKSAAEDVGLRTSTTKRFGMSRELSEEANSAIQKQADLQQQLNDLHQQRAEILEGMPPRAAEIAALLEKIKKQWRDIWITGISGKRISRAILRILQGVSDLLDSDEAKQFVRIYASLAETVGRATKRILENNKFREQFIETIIGAVHNFRQLFTIFQKLVPYLFEAAKAINRITTDALEFLLENLRAMNTTAEEFGDIVRDWGRMGLKSFLVWSGTIVNLVQGFKALSERGGLIDRFERGMLGISEQFESWAKSVDTLRLQSYFEGSLRILRAVGRVLLGIGDAIGKVLGDRRAVAETVRFLDLLAGGFSKFGDFMREAIIELGPKMTDFFIALGGVFEGEGSGLIRGVGRVVDLMTKFLEVADKILPSGILEYIITLRLGMMGLGFAVGQALVPFARLGGVLQGLLPAMGAITVGLAAFGRGPLSGLTEGLESGVARSVNALAIAQSTRANLGAEAFGLEQNTIPNALKNIERMQADIDLGPLGDGTTADDLFKAEMHLEGLQNRLSDITTDELPRAQDAVEQARMSHARWSDDLARHEARLASVRGPLERMGSAFRSLAKVAVVLPAIVGAVLALHDNFWGITDSIKKTIGFIKDFLQPSIDRIKEALGGRDGTTGALERMLEILDTVDKVFGFIVLKVLEITALLATPMMKVLLEGVAIALERFNALAENIEAIFNPQNAFDLGKNFAMAVVNGFALALTVKLLITAVRMTVVAAGVIAGRLWGAAMAASSAAAMAPLMAWRAIQWQLASVMASSGAAAGTIFGAAMVASVVAALAVVGFAAQQILSNLEKKKNAMVSDAMTKTTAQTRGRQRSVNLAANLATHDEFQRPVVTETLGPIMGTGHTVIVKRQGKAIDEIGAGFAENARNMDQLYAQATELGKKKKRVLKKVEEVNTTKEVGREALAIGAGLIPGGGALSKGIRGGSPIPALQAEADALAAEDRELQSKIADATKINRWARVPEYARAKANQVVEAQSQLKAVNNRIIGEKANLLHEFVKTGDVTSEGFREIQGNIAALEDRAQDLESQISEAHRDQLVRASNIYAESSGFMQSIAGLNLDVAIMMAQASQEANVQLAEAFLNRAGLQQQAREQQDKAKLGQALRDQMGGGENAELISRIASGDTFGGEGSTREIRKLERRIKKSQNEGGPQTDFSRAAETSSTVSQMIGFSENKPGKGAVMKFDEGSLTKFENKTKGLRTTWGTNIQKMVKKLETLKKDMPKALEDLAREINKHAQTNNTSTLAGALHNVLQTMLDDVNNMMGAFGQAGINVDGFTTNSTVQQAQAATPSGGGGGGASSAVGDSRGGADIWNGHPPLTGPLAGIVGEAVAQGLAVSSTTDHSILTTTGNRSHHADGNAVDLTGTPAAMQAVYNQLVPLAQAGQLLELIYKNNGWQGSIPYHYGARDHFDHVHVAADGNSLAGGLLNLSGTVTAPGMMRSGGALGTLANAMANAAFDAASGFTPSGAAGTFAGVGASQSLGGRADQNRALGRSMMEAAGFASNQWPSLDELWRRESGWIETAGALSRAYGIPQALPADKMASAGTDWVTNPATQIAWGLNYIAGKYGNPAGALAFKNSSKGQYGNVDGWYGHGGQFTAHRPTLIGVGERGPEDVSVQPTRRRKQGGSGGGNTTVINTSIHLGSLIANDEGIEELADKVGISIRDAVRSARRHTPQT